MRRVILSPDEEAWLFENRAMFLGDYHKAFCARFGRTDVLKSYLSYLRVLRWGKTGRRGGFQKGNVAGKNPPNRAPIGTEVVKGIYRNRKVRMDGPRRLQWIPVQYLEWEAVHGPLPAGQRLNCMSDDTLNTSPTNWEPVTQSVHARLMHGGEGKRRPRFKEAPVELRRSILAVAKMEQSLAAIGKRGRSKGPRGPLA